MIPSSDKMRRLFNVFKAAISEVKQILLDQDRIEKDKFYRSHLERKLEEIGEIIGRTKIRNDVFKVFKQLRNNITHTLSRDHKEVLTSVNENLNQLESFADNYLNENFSKNDILREFEKFGEVGSQAERIQFIDAILDRLGEHNESIRTKFPKAGLINQYSIAVEDVIKHPELLKLAAENSIVATQITEEIANWASNTYNLVQTGNPFTEEERLLSGAQKLSLTEFLKTFEGIHTAVSGFYTNSAMNLSFFEKKVKELDKSLNIERVILGELKAATKGVFKKGTNVDEFLASETAKKFKGQIPFNQQNYRDYAKKKSEEALSEAEILRQNYLRDWEINLLKKRQKYELDEIDKARSKFVKELYQKIADFQKLQKLLEPFSKDLGRLWDLSSGVWKNSGFEILSRFKEILDKEEAILKLAEMLGRYRKLEKEYEEVEIETVEVKPRFKPRHASKGEIVGVKESNDISSMLPGEAALLANPATRAIFIKKFAEKKLMTYDFKNDDFTTQEIIIRKKEQKQKENKGPIIMCIDVSASMQGTPERIAKTICFALTKIALREERRCFLISFSTRVETIELTDLNSSLDKLMSFLSMSFHGGTDLEPALNKAFEMLSKEDYQGADVLTVSDFVLPELKADLVSKIEEAKSNQTKFHSLTIGESANQSAIKQFNHNWVYNIKGENANEALVKQIKQFT